MDWLKDLRLRWEIRKCNRNELKDINRLITKAGRRCAHDLAHACSDVWTLSKQVEHLGGELDWRSKQGEVWRERSIMWLEIFDHADGGKNYRDNLHIEINRLDTLVNKYTKWFEEQGIDNPYPPIPF